MPLEWAKEHKPSISETQRVLTFGLALAALGNLIGLLEPPHRPPKTWSGSAILLLGGSLLAAVRPAVHKTEGRCPGYRQALEQLSKAGLNNRNLKRSLAAGAMVGMMLGSPGLALFKLPENVLPAARAPMGLASAVRLIFGQILFSTALSEELAFRGILQRKLRNAFDSRDAVLLSSLFFALWHGVFNARTLTALGINSRLRFALASALQISSVYIGGLAFGLLHEQWGNLAGPVVAHWLTDVLLNVRFLIPRATPPAGAGGGEPSCAG